MTMYAQKAFITIMSDPGSKEKLQYAKWKKNVKPADPELIKSLLLKGQGLK